LTPGEPVRKVFGMGGRDRPSALLASWLDRATVLVVDDREAVRDALRRALEPLGAIVLLAKDGEEALGVLEAIAADLVLCDVAMPGVDGIELVRRLRARPAAAEVAVLAMSNTSLAPELVARFGFDGFLTKPFGYRDLGEVLRRVAADRPAWRERQQARLRLRAGQMRQAAAGSRAASEAARLQAQDAVDRAAKLTSAPPPRSPERGAEPASRPRFRPELL
jgi:CheY-like chemotaxis protein